MFQRFREVVVKKYYDLSVIAKISANKCHNEHNTSYIKDSKQGIMLYNV